MNPNPESFGTIVKKPSGFLPLAMSFTALALVLGSVAKFGGRPRG